MSFMCCVYLPEGIVMAADSRITQEDTVKKEVDGREYFTKTKYTLSDNGQKIFLLSKVRCGISFCGKAFIDGMTIADYLRQFEISQLDETDTVCTVAEKLLRYYGRSETMFFVAGYLNDEPFVYDISNNKCSRRNIRDESVTYNALWNGKQDAVTKLLNADPVCRINWTCLPLKDGVELAEFLVDLTIKYERFSSDIQTCGGDIDVLIMTTDSAFWHRHKLFNCNRK